MVFSAVCNCLIRGQCGSWPAATPATINLSIQTHLARCSHYGGPPATPRGFHKKDSIKGSILFHPGLAARAAVDALLGGIPISPQQICLKGSAALNVHIYPGKRRVRRSAWRRGAGPPEQALVKIKC